MCQNKFLTLLRVLDERKLSISDLEELLKRRTEQLPVMEERLTAMLRKSLDERETITRKRISTMEEDEYMLAGYDPITKTAFLRNTKYSLYEVVEIDRFIFHEYVIGSRVMDRICQDLEL